MSHIQLTIKNQSTPDDTPTIVLYQSNVRGSYQNCLAWKVIKSLGYMDYHPFLYEGAVQVSVVGHAGGKSKNLSVHNGQRLDVLEVNGGLELALSNTPPTDANEFQVANLTSESLDIHITRAGNLVALDKNVSAKSVVDFQFSESIRIGVVFEPIEEGAPLSLDMMTSYLNTEIPLRGIASADISITSFNSANTPVYQFSLQNIKV